MLFLPLQRLPCKQGSALAEQTALRDLFFLPLLTGLQTALSNLLCFDLVCFYPFFGFFFPPTGCKAPCGIISNELRQQYACMLGNRPHAKALQYSPEFH